MSITYLADGTRVGRTVSHVAGYGNVTKDMRARIILSESNSGYLAVNGQAADKNLDSTEQFPKPKQRRSASLQTIPTGWRPQIHRHAPKRTLG